MAKVAVIGGGIAGIAIAIRLKLKGFEVEVFDKNPFAGGKMHSFTKNGYRFDWGPSLFTMPQYVEELFKLAGRNPEYYFRYKRLDVICKYFFENGKQFSVYDDKQKTYEELKLVFGKSDADNYLRHLKKSKFIYNTTAKIFLENSLHKIKTWLSWSAIKAYFKMPFLPLKNSMHVYNQKQFAAQELVQYFDRFATYNGSNPYTAPGMLNVIPHLESNFGAFIPTEGMVSIPEALITLAEELGVKFNLNSEVTEIITQKKEAIAINVNQKVLYFDKIISNSDAYFTYKNLLKNETKSKEILEQEKSSSAIVFYWGINKKHANLNIHNILFSENYKAEFECLFKNKKIYKDPTIYINITSKVITKDAPENCENWFVMINAPNSETPITDSDLAELRAAIINKIDKLIKTDIEKLIESETIVTPKIIQTQTLSHLGSLYGTSSNSKFAAFLRHKNYSNEIKNLYFCGGSVHPGGGIPLCLLSAKITSSFV